MKLFAKNEKEKKKSGAMPMLACEYEDKKITTNYFQG